MRLHIPIWRIITMVLSTTIVLSCSEKTKDNVASVTLDEHILSDSHPLKADSVWYPADSIYAKRFYVYADTILIVENQKAAGNFLNIYNMHNRQLIAKLLPFGEGPGELLFAQMNYDGNSMRVMDYINRRLCNVDIDRVVKDKDYKPDLLPLSQSYIITSSPVSYGDSILYANPFHYVNRQANIDQQPPRLIASTIENPEPEMPMDFDYMTFNVGQGFLGANAHSGNIFFASNETSTIEFYTPDLKLVKRVMGPVSLPEAKLSISAGEEGKRDVCYKGMLQPEAYRGFTSTADKLFFLYTGKEVPLNNPKNFRSYILCFDWEGNFQKSYSAPARVYALSTSATADTFYATIMDKEGNPKLVKLTQTLNK